MSKEEGLEPRYTVFRNRTAPDGTTWAEPVEEFCFVLKPFTDPLAINALEKYADKCFIEGYDQLSRDLRKVINKAKEHHRND